MGCKREPSYKELKMLSGMFERQCAEIGIVWNDDDMKDMAYLDFYHQWCDGINKPFVNCMYGYTINTAGEC